MQEDCKAVGCKPRCQTRDRPSRRQDATSCSLRLSRHHTGWRSEPRLRSLLPVSLRVLHAAKRFAGIVQTTSVEAHSVQHGMECTWPPPLGPLPERPCSPCWAPGMRIRPKVHAGCSLTEQLTTTGPLTKTTAHPQRGSTNLRINSDACCTLHASTRGAAERVRYGETPRK